MPTEAKRETEEILNAILPPKEWEEDGQIWTQKVSAVPIKYFTHVYYVGTSKSKKTSPGMLTEVKTKKKITQMSVTVTVCHNYVR